MVESPRATFLARSVAGHSFLLIFVTLVIFALGLVMVFGTSSAEVMDRGLNQSTYQALIRQLAHGTLGILLGVGIWMLGYKHLLRLAPFLLVLSALLLLLVLIPGVGKTVNGSKRWISIAGMTLQPSEFAKLTCPLFVVYMVLQKPIVRTDIKQFLRYMSPLCVPLALVFLEPDNGTTALLGVLILTAFLVMQIRWTFWALPCLILVVVGAPIAWQLPYVKGRLHVYFHPEKDLLGKGHQPYQAKIAAGSGQVFGRGLGQSLQKMTYLPEAQNDYIAAIYAEEFGFVGIALLLLLYMLMVYAGFFIAYCAEDRSGLYLAVLATFLVCIQAFLNLGVVSGLLPSTGVNLPFLSQGGSSLLVNFVAIALLLSIARGSLRKEKGKQRLFHRMDGGRPIREERE